MRFLTLSGGKGRAGRLQLKKDWLSEYAMMDVSRWLVQWPWLPATVLFLLILLLRRAERRRAVVSSTLLLAGLLMLELLTRLQHYQAGSGWLHELFVVLVGMVQIRIAGLAVFRVLLPTMRLDPPRILEDVLVIVGYFAWWLVRLKAGGLELSSLVATSAVMTAIIAFSMQDTLGNILAGMALQFDESVEIDQWIRVNDISGRVIQIGWRSTLLQTRNGERVVVPNQVLMKNAFAILGREHHGALVWRRWVWFEVDWNLPPGRVLAAANSALGQADIAGVAAEPPPGCVLMEWKEGVARYALRYWLTDLANDDPTDSQVREHLFAALARAGISLATSGTSILLTRNDDANQQRRAEAEQRAREEALRHVHLFAGLTSTELAQLAQELVFAPFAAGDVITRQGANAHWLYILTRGEVAIWRDYGLPEARLLATLDAGNFFGEMGLMTGSPRTATVVARSEVECWRLDKAAFARILEERPEIAQQVSALLAERLEHDRIALNGHQTTPQHNELLSRIRSFFGLS